MKRLLMALSALILMSMLMTTAVFAYPSHDDYVSDGAVILDETTEESIKEASDALIETKNTRLAVCTVLTTDGESPKKFATALFKEWEIGNGVLLLLVIEDDTFYAVPSNSVAEYLTQDKLSEILNETLEPRFAEKEYSKGALSTVNALSVFLNNNLPDNFGTKKGGFPVWATVLLTIVLIVAILVIGGYLFLVFLEKRNAQRAREEMEARRRMMARGGYGRGNAPGRGMPRDPRQASPSGRAPQISPSGYNARGRNYPSQYDPRMMQSRGPAQNPRGGAVHNPTNVPQNAQQRRPSAKEVTNAATIQINTADIRAAKQGRRNENDN